MARGWVNLDPAVKSNRRLDDPRRASVQRKASHDPVGTAAAAVVDLPGEDHASRRQQHGHDDAGHDSVPEGECARRHDRVFAKRAGALALRRSRATERAQATASDASCPPSDLLDDGGVGVPRLVLLAVLTAAPVGATAHAADAASASTSATADATLERADDALFLRTRSRSFALAQYAVGVQTTTVLVEGMVARRLKVAEDLGASSDPTGTVTLTVRPITSNGRFGPPQATRELPGDAIEVASPAGVKVTSFGCCQQSNAEALLSLASLETLYVRSDGTPLTTWTRLGPPARGRVVAVYLAMTPSDDAVLGTDPSAVGLITLEGEDRVLQRIRVHLRAPSPREAVLAWSSEVGWTTASGGLESHLVVDPARPSRPVWRWTIDATQAIELPLVDDRFDVAAAKLPPDVTLESLAADTAARDGPAEGSAPPR